MPESWMWALDGAEFLYREPMDDPCAIVDPPEIRVPAGQSINFVIDTGKKLQRLSKETGTADSSLQAIPAGKYTIQIGGAGLSAVLDVEIGI